MHGTDGFKYACKRISESTSQTATPTREVRELAEIALARVGKYDRSEVIRVLCKAARRWRDLSLWQRAVTACGADSDIKSLDDENIFDAVEVFGFEAVRPT